MQTSEHVARTSPTGRGILYAVAAAAVVVALGAVALVTRNDVAASPEELATAFVQARASFDAEAATSYFSEDAVVDIGPADSPETLPAEMAWQEASGLSFVVDGCSQAEAASPGEPTAVTCSVVFASVIPEADGVELVSDFFVYELETLDGLIVRAELTGLGSYSSQVWEPFQAWVYANHPEDWNTLYTNAGGGAVSLTDESIELWRRHTEEYVASRAAGG